MNELAYIRKRKLANRQMSVCVELQMNERTHTNKQ